MEKVKCPKCEEYNAINSKYCSNCGFEIPKTDSESTNLKEPSKANVKTGNKKIIGIVVGTVTFLLAYVLTQQFFSPTFDKQLVQMSNELNKNCPIMVDQFTRLDNTLVLPNKTLQYNYTLVETAKAEFNLDTVRKYVEPDIISNVRTNPDMKFLRDKNVSFNYNYRDKNGEFVWKLAISPDDYKE